jgi:hypothetical protein
MRISASSCSVHHSDGRSSYGLQHVAIEAGANYSHLVDDYCCARDRLACYVLIFSSIILVIYHQFCLPVTIIM